MSLDLLKEFGNPALKESVNPCATTNQPDNANYNTLDQDDFGDFEQPEPNARAGEQSAPEDGRLTLAVRPDGSQHDLLMGTADAKPPPSPSFRELNATLKLSIPPDSSQPNPIGKKAEDSTPVTAWPSYNRERAKSFGKPLPLSPYQDDEDDDWGEFEGDSGVKNTTAEASKDQSTKSQNPPKEEAGMNNTMIDLINAGGSSISPSAPMSEPAKLSTTGPPPSNIPPPSVLLSLVVKICHALSTETRDIVLSMNTQAMVTGFPHDDPHIKRLETMQTQLNASARILAGRKWRWKRDTHLAQSMKIGTANAGRAAGMKLTGIDRTEARREDQEVAEVVRLWKQQLGSLKGQIAKINALQSHTNIILPDLSDNLPIRIAKAGEGALTASKSCFLCGLKRDERVARLDVNVEDSFDEWWVEHWGHVDCIRFWEKHCSSLKQR
ncbi:MAG: hypothetical protein Q9218_004819 [Villophora microphyllina]